MHIIYQILNATKAKIFNYLKYMKIILHQLKFYFILLVIITFFIFINFSIIIIIKLVRIFSGFILILYFFIVL